MEEVLPGALNKLVETSVLGAVIAILLVAIGVIVRFWRADLKAAAEALEKERDDHKATRAEWLTDVKEYATLGESVREQLKVFVGLLQERKR